jgi:murein L,D-transpeptidase YcbB/YkuD
MIAKTAVLMRAGLLPAAATFALVCSFSARAEEASAAKPGATVAQEDAAATSSAADSAKAGEQADAKSGDKPGSDEKAAAKTGEAAPDGKQDSAKVKVPEPELPKAADAKSGDKEKAAEGDAAATSAADARADKTGAAKTGADKNEKAADATKADEPASDASKTADAKSAEPAPKKDEGASTAASDGGVKPDGDKADAAKADKDAAEPQKADAAAGDAAKPEASGASSGASKSADNAPAKAEALPSGDGDAKAADAKNASDTKNASGEPAKAESDKAAASKPDADAKAADADKGDVKDAAKKAETPDDKADAKKAEAPAGEKPPVSTSALPADTEKPAAASVSDAVIPPADAVVMAVRQKLSASDKGAGNEALAAFYEQHHGAAIWVSESGLTDKGKAVVKEIGRADDWGLPASDFQLPHVSGSLSPEAAADAEIMVGKAVLKYARYARGGRTDPRRISRLMDVDPPLVAPKTVLSDISVRDQPDAYLRGLQPKHEQFERLRQVLLKLRGASAVEEEEAPEDPALAVKLPPGGVIRAGQRDSQILLLRQRLKVPADDMTSENLYDDALLEAVREFQRSNNLRPDGIIGNNTRAALNGQPRPQPVSGDAKIQRILVNMERWRWLPEDLGPFYVWDNVPEALTRIVSEGKIIHTDRIVVGQPSWPTPIFSADMKTVVFHPSWGVPPGIKAKELAPLLRKSSGGAGLFGIFGGGYSAQAVLDAYQLKAYMNGRQVNANQIDWNSVNINAVSFQQPPGPKNPLGQVKFMFPNSHDVYMHDTPDKELFSRTSRALSHGCMRVQDPRRLAEIILGHDKGWSPDKVRSMFNGYSSTIALNKHIPVHITYMTARVDDSGKLLTFPDFYGLDSRTAAALTGRNVRFDDQPSYNDDAGASTSYSDPVSAAQSSQRRRKKNAGPPTLADAISGLFSP